MATNKKVTPLAGKKRELELKKLQVHLHMRPQRKFEVPRQQRMFKLLGIFLGQTMQQMLLLYE